MKENKENMSEATYKGKMLKDMSREELYELIYAKDILFNATLAQIRKDIEPLKWL